MTGEEASSQRALVTGGGSGMGRAIALDLATRCAHVYVLGRTAAKLDETVSLAGTANVTALSCDIRDADALADAFATMEHDGPVDLLVNAAAGAFHAPTLDISPNGFRAVINSSLTGPFFVLQRWARGLVDAGRPGSAIILTTAFSDREEVGVAHSVAAKAGLEALIRTVAVEWGPHGLRINSLAPGAVLTEGALTSTWSDERLRDKVTEDIPLRRFAEVSEIVDAAAFLLSDRSSYITGTSLVVDGGWRLLPPPFDTGA